MTFIWYIAKNKEESMAYDFLSFAFFVGLLASFLLPLADLFCAGEYDFRGRDRPKIEWKRGLCGAFWMERAKAIWGEWVKTSWVSLWGWQSHPTVVCVWRNLRSSLGGRRFDAFPIDTWFGLVCFFFTESLFKKVGFRAGYCVRVPMLGDLTHVLTKIQAFRERKFRRQQFKRVCFWIAQNTKWWEENGRGSVNGWNFLCSIDLHCFVIQTM